MNTKVSLTNGLLHITMSKLHLSTLSREPYFSNIYHSQRQRLEDEVAVTDTLETTKTYALKWILFFFAKFANDYLLTQPETLFICYLYGRLVLLPYFRPEFHLLLRTNSYSRILDLISLFQRFSAKECMVQFSVFSISWMRNSVSMLGSISLLQIFSVASRN